MFESRNPNAFPVFAYVRLAGATVLSLLLHAILLGAGGWLLAQRPSPADEPPPLEVSLTPPEAPPPVLMAPEPPAPEAAAEIAKPPAPPEPRPVPPPEPKPPVPPAPGTVAAITQAASRQIAQYLFYPPEAIAQGLQGEALVRLFLDEGGNAIAARLERSSGYPLLDDAAVRAAHAVRSMPEGSGRELLLPVRFRLN